MFHHRCQVWLLGGRWLADMLFSLTRQTPTVRHGGERTWWVIVSIGFVQGKLLDTTVFALILRLVLWVILSIFHHISAFFSCVVYPQCCTATAWQACRETILVSMRGGSGGYRVSWVFSFHILILFVIIGRSQWYMEHHGTTMHWMAVCWQIPEVATLAPTYLAGKMAKMPAGGPPMEGGNGWKWEEATWGVDTTDRGSFQRFWITAVVGTPFWCRNHGILRTSPDFWRVHWMWLVVLLDVFDFI